MSAVARRRLERSLRVDAILVASLVVACSGGAPAPATSPPSSTASAPATSRAPAAISTAPTGATPSPVPSGTTVVDPSAPPETGPGLCGVFTAAELIPFLGGDPGPGSIAGPLDTACRWDAGEKDVMIQKVPVDYFEDPYLAEGYRRLEGVGERAYVAPHFFGRAAGALTAEAGYVVVATEDTDERMQIELLRVFLERSPGPVTLAPPTEPPTPLPPLSPPPSVAPAACLVTAEQVSEAAGRAMVQVPGACSWAADVSGGVFEVHLADVPVSLVRAMEGDPVPGVGDEAYGDDYGLLYVRVGERAFSVQVLAMSAAGDLPDALEVAIAVARDAVESLW